MSLTLNSSSLTLNSTSFNFVVKWEKVARLNSGFHFAFLERKTTSILLIEEIQTVGEEDVSEIDT